MIRPLRHAALFLGLAAICWVAAGYLGSNPLALAMTLLIGVFYVVGAVELRRFDQATGGLAQATATLQQAPDDLGAWLDALHPSLRQAVRLRIEGERVGLPGPALTPYLTSLLVLLGMLGTFLGMVVTLKGTGSALESASDLQAIRASLAAPVKGLGLAFGTSLAGVAASAMLGLASTLSRRDRLQAAQSLDMRIAGSLRVFSRVHQREASFKLLQQQGEVLPLLVDRLQRMMGTLEQQSQALNERLVSNQDGFHAQAETAYVRLAASVDRSLQHSLAESARIAGAAVLPVVEGTMAGLAQQAASLQQTVEAAAQRQLDGLSRHLEAGTGAMAESVSTAWRAALAQHEAVSARQSRGTETALAAATATFERQSAALVSTLERSHAQLHTQIVAGDQARLDAWTGSLQAQATHTFAELAQLMQAASAAPRAAAEVIGELRRELSASLSRDNAMLQERSSIFGTLDTLLASVNHASTEQRAAIDSLLSGSAEMLERIGSRFGEKVEAQGDELRGAAARVTGGAVELASLGEAFGFGVQLFTESNDKLMAHLERIDGTLAKSIARSDEQLDYYVAQAREVIDLSILSQKQIVEDLQRLAGERATADDAA